MGENEIFSHPDHIHILITLGGCESVNGKVLFAFFKFFERPSWIG
jgi:hypothetical protein